jgi:hypothetical protein
MKLRWRMDNAEKGLPGNKARRDLIFVLVVVMIGCLVTLSDPDEVFEWIAQKKAVQVDEGLVAIDIVGTGFAVFSWLCWVLPTSLCIEPRKKAETASSLPVAACVELSSRVLAPFGNG